MAAIKCKKCKQYISSTLEVCPECGAEQHHDGAGEGLSASSSEGLNFSDKSRKWLLFSVFFLLLALVIVMCFLYMGKERGDENPVMADTQSVASVDSTQLYVRDTVKVKSAVLELTNDERLMIQGALDLFLTVMTSGNKQRIDSLIALPFTFCDSLHASSQQVEDFCAVHFRRDDILGVHFTLPDSIVVTKCGDDTLDIYRYDVSTRVEATYNRSSLDSIHTQTWHLDAQFTPERKVRSFRFTSN